MNLRLKKHIIHIILRSRTAFYITFVIVSIANVLLLLTRLRMLTFCLNEYKQIAMWNLLIGVTYQVPRVGDSMSYN